ncbi:DUF3868 domain-containing protein [Parabacteroides sp.]|uniref:DUF3868 domain-containing protein n=1 Tax=Parabacteroides sp. TaxID=1869337 RepID=UPI00257A28BA|nr:DUF3868 domain-containing protein [Parabacteroides sp.]
MRTNAYIRIAIGLLAAMIAQAQEIKVKDKTVEKSDSTLLIHMTLDFSEVRVPSNRSLVCTPVITSGDSLRPLTPVILDGRDRHILYERSGRNLAEHGEYELRRENGKEQTFEYAVRTPMAPWMKKSEVALVIDECGCGWEASRNDRSPLFPINMAEPVVLKPALAYAVPRVEAVKSRDLRGQAFLDFPVNRTEIHPEYRKNPRELAAIRATIDSVRHNPYASISEVSIKGYASPEGSYANNERLAKGRAEALLNYIRGLYDFGDARMTVAYEPEDWEGLERTVAEGDLPDKEALLAIIRDPAITDPDRRDARLKTVAGGAPYRFLLQEVYPALRHSDYNVSYTIRAFTTEEAKELIYKNPTQLSLEEMYRVAQTYEVGSPEYNEVFEIAVRIYPDDPTSNLNAALTALAQGRTENARGYLAKTRDCPEKRLAEGVLALLEGKTDEAEGLLNALTGDDDPRVADAAKENLRQLQALREAALD